MAGLLRGVVDTVIANMTPDERVEAINEVADRAINLMTADERRALATRILTTLLATMPDAERQQLVDGLALVPASAAQED